MLHGIAIVPWSADPDMEIKVPSKTGGNCGSLISPVYKRALSAKRINLSLLCGAGLDRIEEARGVRLPEVRFFAIRLRDPLEKSVPQRPGGA
jgi:hypothetical protein